MPDTKQAPVDSSFSRAVALHRSGHHAAAEAAYRDSIEAGEGWQDSYALLASLLEGREAAGEAIALLEGAIVRFPNVVKNKVHLADLLARSNRAADCESVYAAALEQSPHDHVPWAHYGLFLAQANRLSEAEPLLRRSVSLKADDPALWVNYGRVARELGQVDASIAAFEEALSLQPDSSVALNCLGEAWKTKGDLFEARKCFEDAIKADSAYTMAYGNLSLVLGKLGEVSKARELLQKTLDLCPGSALLMTNLASLLRDSCQIEAALSLFRKALELEPGNRSAVSKYLYTLNFDPNTSVDEIDRAHLSINDCVPKVSRAIPRRIDWNRPVRVAFVSGDFCSHSIAYFLQPLFDHIDREKYQVFAYSTTELVDSTTEVLRESCDRWRAINGASAAAVERFIQDDGIDVLIDLAGHTAGGRIDVLAESSAPLRLTWLGYPHKHGLDSISGRIVDSNTDPVRTDSSVLRERLYRMDGCFVAYQPRRYSPRVVAPPALAREYATFCSFNNAAKVNESVLALWSRILTAAPKSRLLLKSWQFADIGLRRWVLERLGVHGIDPQRIDFAPRTEAYNEHLSCYSEADIALDTFPYGGTTTTCEALWMGLPVVTLAGDRHSSRVGVSLLATIGRPEWIGADEEEYISIAVNLSSDWNELAAIRSKMRDRLEGSPLFDGAGFARRFERVLCQAISDYESPQASDLRWIINRGIQAYQSGATAESLRLFEMALADGPKSHEVLSHAGVSAYANHEYHKAMKHLEEANQLLPNSPQTLSTLGSALQKAGRLPEAVARLKQAHELDPDSSLIACNLGSSLLETDQIEEAVELFHRALAIDNRNSLAWSNLCLALRRSGKLMAAVEAGEKAIAVDPSFVGGLSNLGSLYVVVGRLQSAVTTLRKAVSLNPEHAPAWSNLIFALHYWDRTSVDELKEAYAGFAAAFPPCSPNPKTLLEGPLRVGIVSSDLREHAVARFLWPLLRHCDQEQAIIVLYNDGRQRDERTEALESAAYACRDVFGRSDDAVESLIREDGIQFLIDLGGHSGQNRLSLFARKPAPLQATWLGFPGSTGLPAIDHRITDRIAWRKRDESVFPEAPLFLEGGYHCIHLDYRPEIEVGPSTRQEPFSFGSFNNLSKASASTLEMWAEILRKAPQTRLVLKAYQLQDTSFRDDFTKRLECHGIDLARVELLNPPASYCDHLSCYRRIDLCLDTFPYNGTTTTCEAMAMGVPTLTLLGRRICARVGASLLSQVGLESFICETAEGFVDRAIALAVEPDELQRLRGELRERLERSSLGDGEAFAAKFVDALRKAYREGMSAEQVPESPESVRGESIAGGYCLKNEVFLDGESVEFSDGSPTEVTVAWNLVFGHLEKLGRTIDRFEVDGSNWRFGMSPPSQYSRIEIESVSHRQLLFRMASQTVETCCELKDIVFEMSCRCLSVEWLDTYADFSEWIEKLRPLLEFADTLGAYGRLVDADWLDRWESEMLTLSDGISDLMDAMQATDVVAVSDLAALDLPVRLDRVLSWLEVGVMPGLNDLAESDD